MWRRRGGGGDISCKSLEGNKLVRRRERKRGMGGCCVVVTESMFSLGMRQGGKYEPIIIRSRNRWRRGRRKEKEDQDEEKKRKGMSRKPQKREEEQKPLGK